MHRKKKNYQNSVPGQRGPQGFPGPERIIIMTKGPSGLPGRTGQPGHHGPDGDGVNLYIFKKKNPNILVFIHLNNKVH